MGGGRERVLKRWLVAKVPQARLQPQSPRVWEAGMRPCGAKAGRGGFGGVAWGWMRTKLSGRRVGDGIW